MKGKRIFYCEIAYLVGVVVLAIATAFIEKANFGMSMVVAPAYLIHLKVSQYLPFFSFGIAEYVFQALLLITLSVVMGKVKKSYFFSFATVLFYGLVLDGTIALLALFPYDGIVWRVAFFVVGIIICAIAVAFLFHTYLPPASYELFVKEISQKLGTPIGKTKTVYDCCSCLLAVVLSLVFFGGFVGVQWGTVVCALVNGWLIGHVSRFLESRFDFKDGLPLREKLD